MKCDKVDATEILPESHTNRLSAEKENAAYAESVFPAGTYCQVIEF